jgi:phosphohistidine phosphatase
MDLVLWRHAEAQAVSDGCDDLSRELTRKGHRQAKLMADWLIRHLPESARVLVSPAKRAEQTANALGRKFKFRDELVPQSSADDVLSLIKWDPLCGPQMKGTLLLVGHQPYLGELVARLLRTTEQSCPVRKGGVWWLRIRERNGEFQSVVMSATCPNFISRS